MSVPPDDLLKRQLLAEVGDPNATLALLVDTLWFVASSASGGTWELTYLYAKRSALDIRLAETAPNVDYNIGRNLAVSDSQEFNHLLEMREATEATLVQVEAALQGSRIPVIGTIIKVAPESPPLVGMPDANDPLYSGDPYMPIRVNKG